MWYNPRNVVPQGIGVRPRLTSGAFFLDKENQSAMMPLAG